MELIKSTEQAFSLVLKRTKEIELKPFLSALNSKKVVDCVDSEIMMSISAGVAKAIFDLGHQAKDVTEYQQMCNSIFIKVRRRFGMLTLDEIKLACEYGSEGAYGDVMGVNVVQVTKWLQAFVADLRRIKAKKELLASQESKPEQKQLTESDYTNLALSAFDKYKETGYYNDYGNIIYNFLERSGIINFCDQRKKEIKEAVLKEEIERFSTPINLYEKRRFEREKSEILDGMLGLAGKCKKHALLVYFSELLSMGMELELHTIQLTNTNG